MGFADLCDKLRGWFARTCNETRPIQDDGECASLKIDLTLDGWDEETEEYDVHLWVTEETLDQV